MTAAAIPADDDPRITIAELASQIADRGHRDQAETTALRTRQKYTRIATDAGVLHAARQYGLTMDCWVLAEEADKQARARQRTLDQLHELEAQTPWGAKP